MKNFEYAAPRSEAEALELLSPDSGTAAVLAGGTDMVGLMKSMVAAPDRVVNIMEVPSLKQIGPLPDERFVIGATVTLDDIATHPYVQLHYTAVTDAIRGINSMQLQAQGTLGGEVCQRPHCWYFRNGQGLLADAGRLVSEGDNRHHAIFGNSGPAKFVSASRIAPALIALGAEARVIGPEADEEQWVPVADLFWIPRQSDQHESTLQPGQLVTHVRLPAPHGNRASATYEVRQSEGPDFPLAAAAAAVRLDGGRVAEAQVVLGQVAPIPWVSTAAQHALIGQSIDERMAELAGEAAVSEATPLSENGYKTQLAKVAVKRAILRSVGLKTGGFA